MINISKTLDEYLSSYQNKLDILVLGCTHYQLIIDNLNKYFHNQIKILDMSEPFLDKIFEGDNKSIEIYYSKLTQEVIDNTKKILNINELNIYEKNK